MKIVVLDGYTLNPGDLSWEALTAIGHTTIYDRTPDSLIYERAKGADLLLTNKTPLNKELIGLLPDLKYIGVLATGYDVVDIKAAKERNLIVTNIPAYGTKSVAQMVFAHILVFCNHVQTHSDIVKAGAWSESIDFSFWRFPLIELEKKTIGIVGFGRIGQAVADIAQAFGMHCLVYSRSQSNQEQRKNFEWASFDELLQKSDFVSLHCPLTKETKGIINKETLSKMKKSAYLINTSRGGLVVEEDLADALNHQTIAGAGVDVLSIEPPKNENPLLKAKNCIITPHIAWATIDARSRLMDIAVENVKAFIAGKPVNVVE